MRLLRALLFALVAVAAVPAHAQTKAAGDKPADTMEILREKLKANKKLVLVAANMALTEAEAKGFWPLYAQYQRVYQALVIKSKSAMDQFVLAGGAGGDLSASVSTGKDGSVHSFNLSIDIYQIAESGMAVQASWGGTAYSVDRQLD